MRQKILFVINSLVGGGAERVMTRLLEQSGDRADEYDIRLAVLDDFERAFELPRWLTVHQLDCGERSWASIRQFGLLARQIEPDVTLSFLTRSNIATAIASLRGQHPCIISERTSTTAHLGRGARPAMTKALIRLFYPTARRVIAPSGGIAAKLVRDFGVNQHRIDVIPNPVDVEGLLRASADEEAFAPKGPYVIAIGRLVAVKNYELLIRAFAKSEIEGRLVIAGDGPELRHLQQLASRLGLGDRLLLPGFLKNPYRALRNARVFALSSNVEGFPNALLEAVALGVPAVATNCEEGLAEILGGSGARAIDGPIILPGSVLTPVGEVDSFAEGLRLATEQPTRDPIERAELVEGYSARAIVDRYWEAIKDVLQTGEAGPGRG